MERLFTAELANLATESKGQVHSLLVGYNLF